QTTRRGARKPRESSYRERSSRPAEPRDETAPTLEWTKGTRPPLVASWLLLQTIVGGFFGDDDVVHVALAQTRRRHAQEPGAVAHLADGGAPAVAHASAQTADQLIDQLREQSLIRNPALDPLGHQFAAGLLLIAVGRALRHGAQRTHASIALESPALVQNCF